jgi:bifunctional non-homologous end joining protein LigD
VGGASFFQKHAWSETETLARRLADGTEVLAIRDLSELLTLVQYSALELHPWGASLAAPEEADQLIFDLDPGEGVSWPMLQQAATQLRAVLDEQGLVAFAKLSGGKGIHVVVPLARAAPWDEAKAAAKAIAVGLAKAQPRRYVATMSKAARKGRIFIDYLRNGRGSTAVAPYSTRARPSGGIAMPVSWEELADTPAADVHAIGRFDAGGLARRADPWASFRSTRNRLPDPG